MTKLQDLRTLCQDYDCFGFSKFTRSDETKKVHGKLKVKTPKSNDIDEIASLRAKASVYTSDIEDESKQNNSIIYNVCNKKFFRKI